MAQSAPRHQPITHTIGIILLMRRLTPSPRLLSLRTRAPVSCPRLPRPRTPCTAFRLDSDSKVNPVLVSGDLFPPALTLPPVRTTGAHRRSTLWPPTLHPRVSQ